MGTLWYGGNIYTMEREGETVEAVFVECGVIQAVGKKQSLEKQFHHAITESINLKGQVMYPGFVDSHMHIIGHGEKLIRFDLSDVMTSEELKQRLREEASKLKPGEWLTGVGWNENKFPDRKIFHRFELDDIVPDHPVMLRRVCRHALLVNSKALALAKITKETPNPEGGHIVRDENGEATGYLLENAQKLVRNVARYTDDHYIEHAVTQSIDDLVRLGLVGAHSDDLSYYGGFDRTYRTFLKVIDGEKRKFRANLLVHHEALGDMVKEGLHFREGTRYVELGAMKLFADGALGSRTAHLSSPYQDAAETSGLAMHPQEALQALIMEARKHSMPVAIHIIGDLALEHVLDVIEAFPPPEGMRDRLIHCLVAREDLIERMTRLPVILDLQPRFVASDFPWAIDRLGQARALLSSPWKTYLTHGLHCAGGSDAPIEPADPLEGIYTAVARKEIGAEGEGYYPEQRLSVYEAVQLFTTGSAYAIGKEESMGKIKKGYTADFTILDRDLFRIPTDEIPKAKVMKTVVDNTIVYLQ